MLQTLLKSWNGEIEVNNKRYASVEACINDIKSISDIEHIKLYTHTKKREESSFNASDDKINHASEYKITVKKYMTENASPEFDFMAKWNNDNPMPLRTMTGVIEKETRGMVYMRLHGQAEPVIRCMRCGRPLTNPVSQHYGIGPECMSKLGFVCDISDIDTIKKKLVEDVVWEGWIIKSSIIEQEELKC